MFEAFSASLVSLSAVLPLVHEKRYDEFYEQSLECPPIMPTVVAARRSHLDGHANLLFTGMPDRYRDGLRKWLQRYDVPIDVTYMRMPEEEYRKDFIVKRRMYNEVTGLGYRVVRAWEDSPGVIDFWKSVDVPVSEMPRAEVIMQVDTGTVSA